MARPPHEKRMIEEAFDLGMKIESLRAFIQGEVFSSLRSEDQRLMHIQLGHMSHYHLTLKKRIARLGPEAY